MAWYHAAGWGVAGGLAAGLVSLMTAVATAGFSWPWRDSPEQIGPRLFVSASAILLGALVAAATHDSMNGAWPAFVMGVGAPATVRGLLSGIEVSERSASVPSEVPADSPDSKSIERRPDDEKREFVEEGGE
jgi:hypothetical protein